MGLEINIISFIPLLINKKKLNSSESILIYFLFQALASSLLFLLLLRNLIFYFNFILKKIFILPILIKIGAAPFYIWFPLVIENLTWKISLILIIWQKLAPIIILSYLNIKFIKIFIIFSVIIGAIGGLNQVSLRKIITFSSINHIGWIIISLTLRNLLWKIYFIIYSFLTYTIILILNNYNLNFLFQIFFFNKKNSIKKLIIFFNIFSLGGLPPFLGFFPKFIIIQNLVLNYQNTLLIIILFSSLITLYYYLRIAYSSFLFNFIKIKNYKLNFKKTKLIFILTLLNFFRFPLIFIIFKFIN